MPPTPEPNDQHGRRVVRFHRVTEPYGAFSSFARRPIALAGRSWPTVEHYFQAQKFAGTEHEEAIRVAPSPMIAARMGRSRQRPLPPDWETVKLRVMLEALRAKFTQHEDLRELLLGTGGVLLLEHRARDGFWGDGPDGGGVNMLGKLLTQVREELRASAEDA